MDVAVNFTLRPLYTGHDPNRRLDGPQRWCGLLVEEKNLCLMPGIDSRIIELVP